MFRGYLERNSFLIMFQKDIAKKERKEKLLNTVRDYSEYSTIQVPFKRKFNITKKDKNSLLKGCHLCVSRRPNNFWKNPLEPSCVFIDCPWVLLVQNKIK